MKKEKVYIVVSHKHVLKSPGTKNKKPVWDVSETVEFVNQLRNKHVTTSVAIGDYLNRVMISGARSGMADYDKFETYIRSKYEKQMKELDSMYLSDQVKPVEVIVEPEIFDPNVIVDEFGIKRERTVFDKELVNETQA